MKDAEFKVGKNGASVSLAKKKIAIELENGAPILSLTNEYGNVLRYSLTGGLLDILHAELWRFVKESQH